MGDSEELSIDVCNSGGRDGLAGSEINSSESARRVPWSDEFLGRPGSAADPTKGDQTYSGLRGPGEIGL